MALLLAPLAFASPASATRAHIFDFAFGSGELQGPKGIALNETTGNVYVVNAGVPQVNEYSESGTPLSQFDGAAAPTGPLEAPKDIAIDNSKNPLDPSEGDVYVSGEVKVAGEAVHVIYKFSEGGTYLGQITTGSGGAPFGELFGIAVDPAGQLWAFQEDKEIDHYSNALENELEGSCESPRMASPGFAVDSEDNLYVNTGNKEFAKLASSCEELIFALGKGDASEPSAAAAVDTSSNEVLLDNITSGAHFTAEAKLIDRFAKEEALPAGDLQEGAGIAVNSASAKKLVYVADHGAGEVKVYEEVALPTPVTLPATGLAPEKATLNGTVNPEGVQVSSCVFEFGETTAYGQSVPCQPSPGEGEEPVAVSAELTGLACKTYHYRVVAANINGSSASKEEGKDQSFTLCPGIEAAAVSDVSADAATLNATINPHHVSTEAFFQYGPTTAYGTNVPASPIALGEGEGPVEVGPEHVQGLSANSTYHYRIVAIQEGRQFPGPDQSFTTQGAGGALTLPDDRAWELVSPPEQHGGVIEAPGGVAGLAQAAAGGGAFSYVANAPTEASPEGSAGLVQVLSTHGAAGWSSKDIANPHSGRTTGRGATTGPEYELFSEELAAGLIQPWGLFEPSLSEAASEQTPYIRALGGCSANCYEPLVSAKPGHQNALAGFGEELACEEENGKGPTAEVLCGPLFLGASPDLKHVVLLSAAPLAEGAGREQLYEWSGGALSEVSLLPKNEAGEELSAPEGQARLGVGLLKGIETVGAVKHAISGDGRRVFWEVGGTTPSAQHTLYVRDSERGETLELDSAEAACLSEAKCESGGGRFQIASTDGERVLFSDLHRLGKDSSPEGDLYECEIVLEGGKLACELSDLTPEAGGEGARVQGSVLGASGDLSTVYFVALGALPTAPNARGQSPIGGQPNLYVRRGGTVGFIATLAEGDLSNWQGRDEFQPARVSSDGRYLAFMSERPLTGYDNRDAVSGRRDAEVYEYDAQGGRLSCVSCDPSGARPRGVEFGEVTRAGAELVLGQENGTWLGSGWVAALLPGSPSFTTGGPAYQTRSLLDSGRVFFDQLDPLVPQDVNGNWDVYEREPVGVGGCKAGAVGFEAASESCLGMISSGSSARQSILLDSSKSGADVFILTSERLTGKDIDESRDVYDAHECGVGWPCAPDEVVTSPPCTTEASCRAAPSPQPQIFGAPASASFSGPGNPPPPPPVKPKPPTPHQLLLKALASCHKRYAHPKTKRSKAKRSSCERQARRKYGSVVRKGAKAKQGAKGGHR